MGKVILLLCLVGLVFAQPDSLVLQPDAADGCDTWLISGGGYNDKNQGTHEYLVFNHSFTYAPCLTLIRFDLSSIPSGATIDSAFIYYTILFYSDATILYTAAILRSWGEGNGRHALATSGESSWDCCRYDTTWGAGGCNLIGTDRTAYLDSQVVATSLSPLKTDVTYSTRYIMSSGNNYGYWQYAPSSIDAIFVASSDYGTAGPRPELKVYYRAEAPATGAKWREVVIDGKLQTWRTQ